MTLLTFGTFDVLHDGHRNFFREARKHADRIIAVVARDETVLQLKSRRPLQILSERIDMLRDEKHGERSLVDLVVAGDKELGAYAVIKEHRPDIIAFGYDQTALKENLSSHLKELNWEISMIDIKPYQPEIYHSSLLRVPNL